MKKIWLLLMGLSIIIVVGTIAFSVLKSSKTNNVTENEMQNGELKSELPDFNDETDDIAKAEPSSQESQPTPTPPPPASPTTTPPEPVPTPTPTPPSPSPIQQTPAYVMPDKPIIESFCDDKGNCACSSYAGSNSNCSISSNTTIHVGETLNFTIKVSGEETSGILAFILPQGYDWVKEGGIKPWGTDLTYTKTFSQEDISAHYFMYAYIKSSNDNYHRRSSGCNWISYSCDDSAQIIYTVLP